MPLLTPSDPAPSSLQNHSLPPDFAARCGEQLVRGHVCGCTRVPLSSQPPGPFSSPRAWPAHLSVAGEGTPPSSAGLCLVSTELWLEDSASQTLTVHPEGPDCIASHNKNAVFHSSGGFPAGPLCCAEGSQLHPKEPFRVPPLGGAPGLVRCALHPALASPCSSRCRWPARLINQRFCSQPLLSAPLDPGCSEPTSQSCTPTARIPHPGSLAPS